MWYEKKKVWTALVTVIAVVAAHYTGNPEIREAVTVLGTALVMAIGLEDFGKAKGSAKK